MEKLAMLEAATQTEPFKAEQDINDQVFTTYGMVYGAADVLIGLESCAAKGFECVEGVSSDVRGVGNEVAKAFGGKDLADPSVQDQQP